MFYKLQLLMQGSLALLLDQTPINPKACTLELDALASVTGPAAQPAYVSANKRPISPKTPQMTTTYSSSKIAL